MVPVEVFRCSVADTMLGGVCLVNVYLAPMLATSWGDYHCAQLFSIEGPVILVTNSGVAGIHFWADTLSKITVPYTPYTFNNLLGIILYYI